MKVKNKLLGLDMVIYQDDDWFKFSLDSVFLANFVTVKLSDKKIIDLACGNAPIPLLLSLRTKASIYGIELQDCVYSLGMDSIFANKLNNQISLLCGDIKKIKNYFSSESFDVVTCNPPYFKAFNDAYFNNNYVKSIARHEIFLDIDDVLMAGRYLLKNGGNFAIVHRSERFMEIITKMRGYNIEPKRVQFIYSKIGRNSDLFLVEGKKNGHVGLKVMPPIFVHNDDGSYTDDVKKFFEKR